MLVCGDRILYRRNVIVKCHLGGSTESLAACFFLSLTRPVLDLRNLGGLFTFNLSALFEIRGLMSLLMVIAGARELDEDQLILDTRYHNDISIIPSIWPGSLPPSSCGPYPPC
jgi:hypothetical protein